MADDSVFGDVEDDSTGKMVAKYFVHGAAYSLLMLVLAVVWAFLIVFMVILGSIVGLIASLAVLFMMVGWLNAQISQYIWKIDVKQQWLSLLGHGFLLFIVMLIASIPSWIIEVMMSSADLITYLMYSIVSFIVYSLINGYIAKHVAEVFPDDEFAGRVVSKSGLGRASFRGKCSNCGAVYMYKYSTIGPSGTVKCFNCAQLFAPKIPAQPPMRRSTSLPSAKYTIIESTKLQTVCPSCGQKGNYSDKDVFLGSIRCHNCGASFSPSGEGNQ